MATKTKNLSEPHLLYQSKATVLDANVVTNHSRMTGFLTLFIGLSISMLAGCATPAWERTNQILDAYDRDLASLSPSQRFDQMANEMGIKSELGIDSGNSSATTQVQRSGYRPTQTTNQTGGSGVQVRAQSPDGPNGYGDGFGYGSPNPGSNSSVSGIGSTPAGRGNLRGPGFGTVQQAQTIPATAPNNGGVEPAAYQYPEVSAQGGGVSPSFGLNSPNIGSPNEMNSLVQPFERGGNASAVPYGPNGDFGTGQNAPFNQNLRLPDNFADIDVYVTETQTGRINFGGAYNSDNGIVGQFTIDEKNFDITKFPRRLRDFSDGTAFRGAGQTFRLELVPGANVQRYLVSFSEPYMLGTDYSFSASAYYFDRQYFDWDENRLGGRLAIGRRLTQDLSISAGVRMERVNITNPRLNTSPQLNDNVGRSNLFLGNVGLIRDTRDHPFLATEGSYLSMTYSQAFGDYSFARGDLDFRRYRLLYERPDGSGRHTVSYGTKLGFSGSSTPVFENYFAGGFSTLRGFDFRGAAPVEGGVRVGGEFQWLNSLEYMFPITADDMIKGVVFCDFGTVEESIELNKENFRVAPGFGFRIHMPAAGIGAPLAFDFAFPVSTADGDEEKVFSFYLGVLR